jgi:N-acetylneuraminic acid mutarotase
MGNTESKWNTHQNSLPAIRGYHAAVAIDDHRILVTGGVVDDHASKSVEMFDIDESTTSTIPIPMMSTRRYLHAAICHNNYAYVFGGAGLSGRLNSVERLHLSNININDLSTSTTKWEQMQPMNEAREGCAAAIHKTDVYIFGGYDHKYISSMEKYDISKNSWEAMTKTQMKEARTGHVAITAGDKIFVMGGFCKKKHKKDLIPVTDSMEVFCPSTQTWENGPSIPSPLAGMSGVLVGKFIVLTGGYNNQGRSIQESYVFDTESYEWYQDFKIPRISAPRSFHSAVMVKNDTICIMGGLDQNKRRMNSIETITFQNLARMSTDGMSLCSITFYLYKEHLSLFFKPMKQFKLTMQLS